MGVVRAFNKNDVYGSMADQRDREERDARRTCEITAREILECTWDDIAGVWDSDEMSVEDRSSRLLPIRADRRQRIGALEKVG